MQKILLKALFYYLTPLLCCLPLYGTELDDEKKEEPLQHEIIANEQVDVSKDEVFDYTEAFGLEVNHLQQPSNTLQTGLERDVEAIVKSAKDEMMSFLSLVSKEKKTDADYRYIFSSPTLIGQKAALETVHQKRYHLIEGISPHNIIKLFGWLELKKGTPQGMSVKGAVCLSCHSFFDQCFKIKVKTNPEGCFGLPFPTLETMPILALTYITSHFKPKFIEKCLLPIMGCVSKEQAQAKDQQVATLSEALNQQENESKEKKICMLKSINEHIYVLRELYGVNVYINTDDQQSVETFIQQAQAKYKKLEKIWKKVDNLHDSYQGNDWKVLNENNQYWRDPYLIVDQGMKEYDTLVKVFLIFCEITQNLYMMLPLKKAKVWGIEELFKQLNYKKIAHQLRFQRLKEKIEVQLGSSGGAVAWRFLP
ncbi:MAG: hypothetical protein AAF335_04310 [Bacteroidota bacterium]